jgi:hypothetical protein
MTSEIRLAPPVRPTWFVEFCEICGQPQVFLVGGLELVACCLGCGDERIAPFQSEVA